MPFPTEFPQLAVHELVNQVQTGDIVPDRAALAVYETIGYGLNLYFGDVKYPMTTLPAVLKIVAKLRAVATPENIALMKTLPMTEIVAKAAELHAKGVGPALILIRLVWIFGTKILPLIKIVRSLLEELNG